MPPVGPPVEPGGDTKAAVTIRPATPADAEAIARLADELNADQGEPTGLFTPDLIRREAFRDHPEFRLLVAERAGEVVGYALFHPTFATELGQRGLYLYDLAVTAERARAGHRAGAGGGGGQGREGGGQGLPLVVDEGRQRGGAGVLRAARGGGGGEPVTCAGGGGVRAGRRRA